MLSRSAAAAAKPAADAAAGSSKRAHATLKDFSVVRQLGKGAYAAVFLVTRLADGLNYALKRVQVIGLSKRELIDCLGEVRFLASIHCVNVVRYFDSFIHEGKELIIVMEYCGRGDLAKLVARGPLPEPEALDLFVQLVEAVRHLHALGIVHRDLKPANVFLADDGGQLVVKVGDLNVAKLSSKGLMRTQIGTPLYMAPELWADVPSVYGERVDVWAVGCILYELVAGRPPFVGRDMSDLSRRVRAGAVPPLPTGTSPAVVETVAACLRVDPAARPSAAGVLALPCLRAARAAAAGADRAPPAAEPLLNTIRLDPSQPGLRGLGAGAAALPSPQFESGGGEAAGFRVGAGAGAGAGGAHGAGGAALAAGAARSGWGAAPLPLPLAGGAVPVRPLARGPPAPAPALGPGAPAFAAAAAVAGGGSRLSAALASSAGAGAGSGALPAAPSVHASPARVPASAGAGAAGRTPAGAAGGAAPGGGRLLAASPVARLAVASGWGPGGAVAPPVLGGVVARGSGVAWLGSPSAAAAGAAGAPAVGKPASGLVVGPFPRGPTWT